MSQHDTLTLEPCPFCGRHVEHVSRADNHSATGKTYIVSCFCGGYSACAHQQEDTLEEVVAAWNRRAALSATQPTQVAQSTHWTEREPVRLAPSRVGRVYVAGPMTGIADFNFPEFNAEAEALRAQGLSVLNPADHGIVVGANWADYLRHDIAGLASCERIHLLRGWSKSKGAQLEVTIAKALGMVITYQDGAEPAQAVQSEPVKPLFAAKIAARKWAELQEQGARMQSIAFDGGKGGAGTIDPWGVVRWSQQAAQGAPKRPHVGDSKFESWYQAHPKANGGDKQLARDAYAAGMSDPAAAQAVQSDPTLRERAEELVQAGHAFWKDCLHKAGGGAVRWLSCDDGTLIVFTRGEYRHQIMSVVSGDAAPTTVFKDDGIEAAQATQGEPMSTAKNHHQWLERVSFWAACVAEHPEFQSGPIHDAAREIEAEADQLRSILMAQPAAGADVLDAVSPVGDWSYSHDEERFSGQFDTKEAAIAEGLSCGARFVGQVNHVRDIISDGQIGWDIYERIGEILGDEIGEVAECFTLSPDQQEVLGKVVLDWIESGPGFNCWGIKDVEPIDAAIAASGRQE